MKLKEKKRFPWLKMTEKYFRQYNEKIMLLNN